MAAPALEGVYIEMHSYTVHLIRHGLTQGNLEGRYIGSTDLPLCAQGVRQLQERRAQAPYPPAAVCYCSPLRRCLETAKLLYPDLTPQVVTDFRETDFGGWENKTAKELAQEDPDFLKWMEGGAAVTPPGGEDNGWFMQRTCAAFEHVVDGLLRTGTSSAVIIAHGGTLMSVLSAYGLPRAPFYDWLTEPGCGYSLRITPGLWMRGMVAEVYDTIPPRDKRPQDDAGHMVVDLARAAADRAYGKKDAHGGEQAE